MKEESPAQMRKKNVSTRGLPMRTLSLKADEVGAFFGFLPVESFMPGRQDREYAKELLGDEKEPVLFLEEDIAFLKKYIGNNWNELPHPLMLISHTSVEKKRAVISLRILGIASSAAEALAIRTALSILEESGHSNNTIFLGSIGDRESMNDFDRTAASFIRKNMPLMPLDIRKAVKENPLSLLTDKTYADSPFADRFPTPIASLSPSGRNHLKEVIEYIEAMETPYTLESSLMAARAVAHHTVFEIREENGGEVLARGVRLSPLTRRMGAKRESSFLSVIVYSNNTKTARKKMSAPKFHFVQLGYTAKLLSLPLAEKLRKIGVPVIFHISRDKLLSQLGPEEKTKFLIIMGQKEALDHTIVVRDNETRAQESVPIENAPAFIKRVLKRGRV